MCIFLKSDEYGNKMTWISYNIFERLSANIVEIFLKGALCLMPDE